MAKQLEQYTAKELGQMAKLQGIPGWHSMCKKALIEALSSIYNNQSKKKESGSSVKNESASQPKKKKSSSSKSRSGNSGVERELSARQVAASVNISFNENGLTGSSVPVPGTPGALGVTPPSMLRKMTVNSSVMDLNCELAQKSESDKKFSEQMKEEEDNLTLKARDAYWIQATWHVRQKTKDRVRGALGSDWHYAKPAIRLFEVRPNDGFNSRRALRNIEVLLKANNWFIDVDGVPASYQIELGYITENGKFFTILTSNTVTTPSPDTVKGFDAGFDFDEALDEYELKMNFKTQTSSDEERHVRQMIDDQRRKLGAAAFAKAAKLDKSSNFDDKGFPFHLDAKALIHGKTLPGAHVTVRGYPIIVDEDGEFLMRVDLPDRRQIFPVVASSGDGIQQRTIVLSLERVTRFLEPVYCMFDDEE
ncbi:MAG: DUF4912 domain-containing protein [Thermoguttaceae bacterium]|nr:DUF4912 domain-containing protein [Thermoguttaceae bacterium]